MIFPEILYSRAQAKDLVTQQNEIIIRSRSDTPNAGGFTVDVYRPPSDRIFILSAYSLVVQPLTALQSVIFMSWRYVYNGLTFILPLDAAPNTIVVAQQRTGSSNGQIWLPGGGVLQAQTNVDVVGLFGMLSNCYGVTIPKANTTVG